MSSPFHPAFVRCPVLPLAHLLGDRHASGAFACALLLLPIDDIEPIAELIEVLSNPGPVLAALIDLHGADSSMLLAFRWLMHRLTQARGRADCDHRGSGR